MSTLPHVPPTGLVRSFRKLRWSLLKRLSPTKPVILPFDRNLKLAVRPIDRTGKAVYLNGYSDRELALILHQYLKPGMTYLDVGSHLGQFAILASSLVGNTGGVHAFEACREAYQLLDQNATLNAMNWLTINHKAVFNEPGSVKINVCVSGQGEFNSISDPLRPDDQVTGFEEVEAVTIDGYCEKAGIENIDLMKIDVNGPEMQVIQGGKHMLGKPGKRMIIVEFNDFTTAPLGYTTIELKKEIEALGFRICRFNHNTDQLDPEPARARYDETVDLVCVKDQ